MWLYIINTVAAISLCIIYLRRFKSNDDGWVLFVKTLLIINICMFLLFASIQIMVHV